jgi:AraC-like DNA-binding protein
MSHLVTSTSSFPGVVWKWLEATSSALGLTPPSERLDVDGAVDEDLLVSALRRLQWQAGTAAILLTKVSTLPPETFGMVGHALASRPTLGEGVQSLSRYLGLLSPVLALELLADGSSTRISLPSGLRTDPVSSIATEVLLVQIARLTRDAYPLQKAMLRQDPPADRAPYDQAFGCLVEFGSDRDALLVPSHALAMRLPPSDGPVGAVIRRGVGDALRRLAVVGPVSMQVRGAILELLLAGIPSMTRVASRLGTTVPLLAALLRDEEQSFAGLRESLLHQLCCQYLQDPDLTLLDVAFATGFVELDVFDRTFERWSGKRPDAFRAGR